MSDIELLLNLNYDECVEFLASKYGRPKKSYFSNSFCKSKNTSISRTNQGLVIHHIDEDKAIMLSQKEFAINNPFEYQMPHRLVYCDLLEHLLLHIKIVEFPNPEAQDECGIGGVVNFLVPELNDIYSGIKYKQKWKIALVEKIVNRYDEYLLCIKKIIDLKIHNVYPLLTSFNSVYGIWEKQNNKKVFNDLIKLGIER